jgi:hypothetical protein
MITVAACSATALLTWAACSWQASKRERRMRLQLRTFVEQIRAEQRERRISMS